MNYTDRTGLSSRVSRLNPRWNEKDEVTGVGPDENAKFEGAVKICGLEFVSLLSGIVESDLPARGHVEAALINRVSIDPSGEILCFDNGGMPWRGHLYDLEREHEVTAPVKFVRGCGEYRPLL